MGKILDWNEYLFCNGEKFCIETEWFTPNTYNKNFKSPPTTSGVYFFVVYTHPQDLGNIVYVGSAKNILQRYTGHQVKTTLFQMYWYVKFYFTECENCREKEKRLIKKFNPRFNIQHNGHRSLNSKSTNLINAIDGEKIHGH